MASVFRSAASAARRSGAVLPSSSASLAAGSSSSSSSTLVARRGITTSSPLSADAASTAKASVDSAASATKGAIDGAASATKSATSSAQSQLAGAADKAKQLGGPYAARASSLFSSLSETVIYNARVVGAIAKQVYVAERLAPPTSTQTIVNAYKSIWSFVSNPASWSRILQNGDWKKVGIYSVEALGIFTIGEMIGRRSIVGYSLNDKHHGHGHH
ncbi:hypothetical protein OC861_001273 [Tilletia horrida]|nr:hypothetical protein OC861_001273 [Tilletia horrida]